MVKNMYLCLSAVIIELALFIAKILCGEKIGHEKLLKKNEGHSSTA